jgi:hypothetical protein
MAVQTVKVCDFDGGACGKPAQSYRLWRDGDSKASAVDLCEEHAAPLEAVMAVGETAELPVKPRVRMEVTALRPTSKTRSLKKE